MNLIVGLMTTIMTESVQNWHFYLEAWGAKTTHDTHKNVSGMEDTLEEIFLSHNLLGDNLSPVFSTRFDTKTCFIRFPLTQNSFSSLLCNVHLPSEFQNLKFLRVLDLSHNGLTGIAENLIKGCEGLKVQKDCWRGVEKEAM